MLQEAVLACAVCSTADRTLAPAGDEQPFERRLRVAADARSGASTIDGATLRDRRLELAFSAALGRSELIGIAVPVLWRTYANGDGEKRTFVAGDVEVRTQFVTFRSLGSTRQRAGVLADVGFPTAPLARDAQGVPLPVAFQPGCGSIAPAIGGFYALTSGDWSAFASAQVVLPLSVREGPHAGRAIRGSGWTQWQPASHAALRLGVLTKLEARGERAPGEIDPDSGGFLTFASAHAIVMPVTDLVFGVGIMIPIAQVGMGSRRESAIVSINAAFDF